MTSTSIRISQSNPVYIESGNQQTPKRLVFRDQQRRYAHRFPCRGESAGSVSNSALKPLAAKRRLNDPKKETPAENGMKSKSESNGRIPHRVSLLGRISVTLLCESCIIPFPFLFPWNADL